MDNSKHWKFSLNNIFDEYNSFAKLNVSYTCLNNQSLDTMAQDLVNPNLKYLDVSVTNVNDFSRLLRLKDKLKHLFMYNMRTHLNDDIIPMVCQLHKLQSLDLSCDLSSKIFADTILSVFDVNLLLDELCKANLKDLRYLDVSGKSYKNLNFQLTNSSSSKRCKHSKRSSINRSKQSNSFECNYENKKVPFGLL